MISITPCFALGGVPLVEAREQIVFRVFGDDAPTDVRFYLGQDPTLPPTRQLRIDEPIGCSINESGDAAGVVADGQTSYAVHWDPVAEGLGQGQQFTIMPETQSEGTQVQITNMLSMPHVRRAIYTSGSAGRKLRAPQQHTDRQFASRLCYR